MAFVPEARKFGFDLETHEGALREVLNSAAVSQLVATEGAKARAHVEAHVRATARPEDADNYAAALLLEDSYSDDYGVNFDGHRGLGNRPIAVVGIPAGRGPNPSAKPPLMVEAETHALTSIPGMTAGGEGI
jgi:hypothetical protein